MTELLLAQGMSPLCPTVGFLLILFVFVIILASRLSDQKNKAGRNANAGQWQCGVGGCHAWNPSHARYCRMCGKERGSI